MEEFKEKDEKQQSQKDRGTSVFVLGLLALIFSLTVSRVVAVILGIIAIVTGSGRKQESSLANAGYIMGIIGLCIAGVLLALIVFSFILVSMTIFMF